MVHIKPKDEVIEFLVCYAAKGLRDAEKKFLEEGYRGNENMEKVSAECLFKWTFLKINGVCVHV